MTPDFLNILASSALILPVDQSFTNTGEYMVNERSSWITSEPPMLKV